MSSPVLNRVSADTRRRVVLIINEDGTLEDRSVGFDTTLELVGALECAKHELLSSPAPDPDDEDDPDDGERVGAS